MRNTRVNDWHAAILRTDQHPKLRTTQDDDLRTPHNKVGNRSFELRLRLRKKHIPGKLLVEGIMDVALVFSLSDQDFETVLFSQSAHEIRACHGVPATKEPDRGAFEFEHFRRGCVDNMQHGEVHVGGDIGVGRVHCVAGQQEKVGPCGFQAIRLLGEQPPDLVPVPICLCLLDEGEIRLGDEQAGCVKAVASRALFEILVDCSIVDQGAGPCDASNNPDRLHGEC